jgi:CrcB protein
MLQNILWVSLGGAIGSALRYLAGMAATRMLGVGFPYGTLAVNVLGGVCIGWCAAQLATHPSEHFRLFMMVGVLGGFTTFSSFSLEVVQLAMRGAWGLAALYVGASLLLALGGVGVGMWSRTLY